jgi:hypothetical protein
VKPIRVWRYSVSLLTILSLLVNVILVFIVLNIGVGLRSAVTTARQSLDAARTEPIDLTVSVHEEVPISTTVPLSDTFIIPIRFDFPLSTQVSTYITIPLLGRQEIVVPVEATIPISHTLEIPLSMAVPVNFTPTLELDIPMQVALPADMLDALEDLLDGFEDGLRLRLR